MINVHVNTQGKTQDILSHIVVFKFLLLQKRCGTSGKHIGFLC
jgi:hypothetical protein